MPYGNETVRFPVRKNPRLSRYDYTSGNYYFITVCTHEKKCIFGYPWELSPMGIAAADCLQKIPVHFPGMTVDKWMVMPNHIHAILILPGDGMSLSGIVGQYKSAVTKAIHTFCPTIPVWQTSFHDHIIRNQADYERIWMYIEGNPARWTGDCFYVPQPEQ